MISLLNNEKQSEDLKRQVREGNKLFLHSKRNHVCMWMPICNGSGKEDDIWKFRELLAALRRRGLRGQGFNPCLP
jgi:hypothetical protein